MPALLKIKPLSWHGMLPEGVTASSESRKITGSGGEAHCKPE